MLKKRLLSFLLAIGMLFVFSSCKSEVLEDEKSPSGGKLPIKPLPEKPEAPVVDPTPEINYDKLYMFDEEMNPEYDSRTTALDTIFYPDSLGQMVLVFDRSEWNKHLDYCDVDISHEESVVAKGFYFTKDNKEWFFKDIGFRIRGNTSRVRPQQKIDNGDGTYSNGKYVQAHFALDFEEWTDDDKKLANSMKGLILKRFKTDPTYSREVYGYNLFRKNGIWIAPRAAYTTLRIQIVDDLDLDGDSDTTEYETINYGVYGMIEEIKKQFLKERSEYGEFKNNKGNLWKCTWKNGPKGPNFVPQDATSIGEEEITPIKDGSGKVVDFTFNTFDYDYKSDDFDEAKTELLNFMEELNSLPNCKDGINDAADIEKIKTFYTEKMEGDLFLRCYAINVLLGMWDDYWVNNNNFYFYFDKSGKAYFIPYDYDNILGINGCNVDAGTQNPVEWGNLSDGKHPLIQKILQVPEYMELYKKYLDEYSNENSYFDDDESIAQIKNWHNMIKDYIESDDLAYDDTTSTIKDEVAYWSEPKIYYTTFTPGNMNYFTVRQKTVKSYLNVKTVKVTFNLNGGTYNGSKNNVTVKVDAGVSLPENIIPTKTNYYFAGWTTEKDGNNYVNKVSNTDITVYAKWISKEELKTLYEYSDDYSSVTFIFRPNDYNCDLDSNVTYTVRLMSHASGWSYSDKFLFTKGDDGNYTLTVNRVDIADGFKQWAGFKFYVKEKDKWLGPNEYKVPYAAEQVMQPEDPNFKFDLWISSEEYFASADVDGDFGTFIMEDCSVIFCYDNNMNGWGNGNGTLNFKLRTVAGSWKYPSYGGVSINVDGQYYKCKTETDDNIIVNNLTHGQMYKITFKYEDENVWVKMEEF